MTSRHAPPLSRPQRLNLWVVGHLPPLLVRDTERVALNMGTGTVGFTSLLALREPGTIADTLSLALLIVWSVTLMTGAAMVLLGMSRSWRVVERAGLMLTALGCFVYSMALFGGDGIRAKIIGILFLAIALAKLIRLLVSTVTSAARSTGDEESAR